MTHILEGCRIPYDWKCSNGVLRSGRIVEKYKLKKIRLYDLRHSMVALLTEADNVNLPAIQKRARHSSSKITSDIYGHISKKYAPNNNLVNKLIIVLCVQKCIHKKNP